MHLEVYIRVIIGFVGDPTPNRFIPIIVTTMSVEEAHDDELTSNTSWHIPCVQDKYSEILAEPQTVSTRCVRVNDHVVYHWLIAGDE